MNGTHRAFFFALAMSILPQPEVSAAECPATPDAISVRVAPSIRFDPSTARYTYAYVVTNGRTSAQEVMDFEVDVTGSVSDIASPAGWRGERLKIRPRVDWGAFHIANPDLVSGDGSVPPSDVQIKPGTTMRGFSFQSPKPPGAAAYHASGYVDLPRATGATPGEAELAAEDLVESCPQLALPLIDQGIVGATVGPVDAIPVRIDVKPGDDVNAVNPASQGVIPVAILGSATFDVRRVNVATISLVPGGARPRRSTYEDVNGDGVPDLLLHFGTADAAIACDDSVLVVAAKTTDGAALAGFDAIRTTGCR